MQITNWNEVYKNGRSFNPASEIVLDKLKLSKGSALDIGCGQGQLMKQLEARGFKTQGIDLSDYSAGIVGNFMTYKFNMKFDLITINLVLAFIQDKPKFIEKVHSLSKKNGRIIIITPVLYDEYRDKYSEREQSISVDNKELRSLLKDDFTNVNTCYGADYLCTLTLDLNTS